MYRPIIGLTTSLTQAKWSVWDTEATVVDSKYVNAIIRNGGVPILLPPTVGADVGSMLDRLDGLCFIGGADVTPGLYGAEPHPATKSPPEHLDRWAVDLIKVAIRQQLPFLAICRGLQLLNVAQGGTLHQHLPDIVDHKGHQPAPGIKGRHTVKVAKGSVLEPLMGLAPEVVTYHHQAVDRIGDGLTPIAWSEEGIVEALHFVDNPWGVGVQWHPEEDNTPVVKTFIDTVRILQLGQVA